MKLQSCIIIVVLALNLVVSVPAQTKPQQKPPEDDMLRIETELVQIEITVTDKQGKLIKDLKQSDFELKADGKPQEIGYFSVGTSVTPARWITTETTSKNKENKTIAPTPEVRAGRYIVLAIDDLHLSFSSLNYTRKALVKFVDQQMAGGDQVALITTSGQLGMFQQFTADRDILKRAIERLSLRERKVYTSGSDVPRITPYQAELIDNHDPDSLAIAVNEIMAQRPGTTRQSATSEAEMKARSIVAENTSITKSTLTTLELIIRGLRDLPGRKSLIMMSDGFLLGGSNQGSGYDLRRITDAATRAGLVIYALDARGLVAMPGSMDASQPGFGFEIPPGARQRIESSSIEAERDGLNALSRDTGGFPIFNNNDLSLGLQKITEDTETYYLLGFEPLVSYRDGRFRKLEVKVRNHSDYKVRSSKGYFAPDDKAVTKAAEKEIKEEAKLEQERLKNPEKAAKKETAAAVERMNEALISLFPLSGIPIEMSTDFVDSGKGEGYLALVGHVDVSKVRFEKINDRYQAIVELAGLIFDEKGKSVDSFSQNIALNLRQATYERMLKSGLLFNRRVKLAPGFYQVRVAAIKEKPRQQGSAASWVEISDLSKKQLALSSIFIASEKENLFANEQAPNQNQTERKIEDASAVMDKPTQISKHLKRGSSVDFTIFAYNGKQDSKGELDLVVQSQIMAGSKVVFASPLSKINVLPEHKTEAFAPYAARLSLANLAPGNYELRLLVIDRSIKTTAKRSISFVIDP
jgi:VWFA-related protein